MAIASRAEAVAAESELQRAHAAREAEELRVAEAKLRAMEVAEEDAAERTARQRQDQQRAVHESQARTFGRIFPPSLYPITYPYLY